MDTTQENLPSQAKDKQYFTEAWDWYADTYLKQSVESLWLAVLALLSIFILALYIFAVQFFFPLSKDLPFAIYVEGKSDDLHVIKPLTHNQEDPQTGLANYLIEYYVRLREEYDYDKVEQQKLYVKSNSSRQEYESFLQHLDPNQNSDSPLAKLKKEGKLEVEIINIEIYGATNSNAKVQFYVHDTLHNTKKLRNITLRFTLSNILTAMLKLVPLEFRVISYGK